MELAAEIDASDMQWDSEGESENVVSPMHESGTPSNFKSCSSERKAIRRTAETMVVSLMHESGTPSNYKSCSSERKAIRRTAETMVSHSTHSVKNMVDWISDEQRQAVREFGFGSILNVKGVEVDEEMLKWLVDNFDVDRRTLNVHGYCLQVTAEDVECVLGLSSRGKDIESEKRRQEMDTELERELNIRINSGEIVVEELRHSICSLHNEGLEFKVKFVLFVVGRLLAPSLDDKVSRALVAVVATEENMENLNWSKFILDNLVKSIRDRDGNGIAGCALFLMV